MEIKSGVYCIESTLDNKQYIGSSQNVFKRRNRHFSELKNNKHKNPKLQAFYNKYGIKSLRFFVLALIEDKKELIIKEQFFIDNKKPWFNINLIANSSLGVKRSDETKEKIRNANLGVKHPEWRNKIKAEAQSGANHWTQKKEFSVKSKIKMSESQKELYENGYQNPVAKEVVELDENGQIINKWSSMSKAAEYYNVTRMTISNIIEMKVKVSQKLKGKNFKYAKEI